MQEILIGIVSGLVSGLGMGGGIILIFFLTFMCAVEQHVAQAANLIFYIPTSIAAILVNVKNRNIDFKLAVIILVFGVLGAIIGANLSVHMNVVMLKKIFGVFLFFIILHEIYELKIENKKRKDGENK